jgi:uncharacterized protein YkwD
MKPHPPARRIAPAAVVAALSLSLLGVAAGSARADAAAQRDAATLQDSVWIDLVDDVRRNDCRTDEEPLPLRADADLQRVAERYAQGGSLQQALEAARYDTEDAAALRIDAVRLDDSVVRRQLRERFCARLANPDLAAAAAVQRGNSLWLIVAVPASNAGSAAPAIPGTAPATASAAPLTDEPESDNTPGARTLPDGIEYEILAQVNEARSRPRRCGTQQYAAAPPLRYSGTLADASQAHAMDMARRGYFDHDTPEGVKPAERLAGTGYRWTLTGENIARGDMGADEAMAGWLRSPGHCANIMEPRFSEMGFGIAADGDRKGALYWVQTFAAPRDDETPR